MEESKSFSSLFVYVPKYRMPSENGSYLEANSLTLELKKGRELDRLIKELDESITSGHFNDLFGPNVIMVPAPRHAPRLNQNQLWASLEMANAISRKLGGEVRCCLERTNKVEKAAFARPGDRPSFNDHVESIRCTDEPDLFTERITVVDDVITTGSTLAACLHVLGRTLRVTEVRAFAAVRTLKEVPSKFSVVDPIDEGRIVIGDGWTAREP